MSVSPENLFLCRLIAEAKALTLHSTPVCQRRIQALIARIEETGEADEATLSELQTCVNSLDRDMDREMQRTKKRRFREEKNCCKDGDDRMRLILEIRLLMQRNFQKERRQNKGLGRKR